MLEHVEHVGTQLVNGLSKFPYNGRLKRPILCSLLRRRKRGDRRLGFHILNNYLGVSMSYPFAPSRTNHLQSYNNEVKK